MKKKHDFKMWAIPACLMIGIGLGIILKQVAAFTLVGLGTGLLITYLFSKKK